MERFPTEIILDIAAYLDLTGDKPTLASLATCSRKYVKVVQPILFRTICPSTNAQTLRLLLTVKIKVGVSALLKGLILFATMGSMTVALLTEMLENGRLVHLEVLRFQKPCLPNIGTFPRLARAIACNNSFPALRVLEVTPYRLVYDIKANNSPISSPFPKLEDLYLGSSLLLRFDHAMLPRLRALQARITSADLDRPFRAVNLRYLCTHPSDVDFRYLEQLSAVTGGQLLSLECSGRALWDLPILLEENGKCSKWMGEAFPHLRYLGGVWIHPESSQTPENGYPDPVLSQIVLHMPALRQLRLVTSVRPGEEKEPPYKRATIAMINAHSSLSSVVIALWNTKRWNFDPKYEVHTEHSFTRSSTSHIKVNINVESRKRELALSAYRWRTV